MVLAMRLPFRRSSPQDVPALPVGREEGLAAALRLSPWLPDGFDPDLMGLFGFGDALVERIGTVDRCLQLNSQQIATMPLRYKHAESAHAFQPRWVTDPDPAWYPNGIHDAVFSAIWSIYARGEAIFWCTSRYETGYPATFTVVDPRAVEVDVAPGGGERTFHAGGVELNPDDVVQVQRNPNGALRGTGALEAYAASIASAFMAERYAADVYRSTGATRVALRSTQRRLSEEQAQEIQAQWASAVQRRGGAPAVLPPDLELLQTLSISPKDLMLLEARDWDARQIAAAFGVPAMLLNIAITGGLVYQAPVQLFDLWWRSELMPCAVKLAEALSRWLPRGHWVEFDPSASLKPDLAALVGIYSKAYTDGAVSLDEYRAAVFDLPPLPEGDAAAELVEEPGAHGNGTVDVPTLPDFIETEVESL
jgi:HK97 family phage portal protein